MFTQDLKKKIEKDSGKLLLGVNFKKERNNEEMISQR